MRTDAELLAAAESDPAAFRELYERYAERVHRFHHSRTRDPDAALDLTAETFAQAWEHRTSFQDLRDGSCGPWFFGIARNLLLQSVRERRLTRVASQRLSLNLREADVIPEDHWLEGMDEDLEQALASLPEGQRQAIEFRVLRDASYDEVADALDCSPTAARIRVHRGLARLRGGLRDTRDADARPLTLTDERTA